MDDKILELVSDFLLGNKPNKILNAGGTKITSTQDSLVINNSGWFK